MNCISSLPFPLAWLTGGTSMEIGGQEESEVKEFISLLPSCWAMGCVHPSVTGHCSRPMFFSYSH